MAQMAGNGSLDGATLHGCVGLVRGRLSAGRLRFTKGCALLKGEKPSNGVSSNRPNL